MERREFLINVGFSLASSSLPLSFFSCSNANKAEPPNVVLIMTDDQGYSDFGVTGNPVIEHQT